MSKRCENYITIIFFSFLEHYYTVDTDGSEYILIFTVFASTKMRSTCSLDSYKISRYEINNGIVKYYLWIKKFKNQTFNNKISLMIWSKSLSHFALKFQIKFKSCHQIYKYSLNINKKVACPFTEFHSEKSSWAYCVAL